VWVDIRKDIEVKLKRWTFARKLFGIFMALEISLTIAILSLFSDR
jgi:hypothetical protein